MPLPLFPAFLGTAGAAALFSFIRALVVRFMLITLLYLLFKLLFSAGASLFLGSDLFKSVFGAITGRYGVYTISQAFAALPVYATQLFFFMHLDEALSMVGATFASIFGMKIFGRALASIGL